MDVETKLNLALASPVEEIVKSEELRELFETNNKPRHYIGIEPSGLLHVGSLLMNGAVINNLIAAGVECHVYLANFHAFINKKLGGSWEKIQQSADYYEEAFKFYCPGVKIVRGSELYHNNDDYWKNVLEFSGHVTLARATRCLTILGRSENEKLDVAQYLYPSMQAVDMQLLDVQIAHAGMDQRKIHMLAREVFPKLGWKPPVALHHHLIPALTEPPAVNAGSDKMEQVAASKMSKSKPDSAIFIHDTAEEIKRKISKAYCPATTQENPVLEFAKYLVFSNKKTLKITRPEKYGGNIEFNSYEEMENAFTSGKLHAMDLKNGVASSLNEVLSPVRRHFEGKKELLEVFKEAKITR